MEKRDVKYCVLDTNVLVYAINKTSREHESVHHSLQSLVKGGYRFCVTEQIVRELLIVVTQRHSIPKPLSPMQAKQLATNLLYRLIFLPSNNFSRLFLLELVEKYQLSGRKIHDANIAAVMHAHGVKKIVTFNQKDFLPFKEVELLQP